METSDEPKPWFRITKGRIAVSIALMPVFYVLNIGPLAYYSYRFGIPPFWLVADLCKPLRPVAGVKGWRLLFDYVTWWQELAGRK